MSIWNDNLSAIALRWPALAGRLQSTPLLDAQWVGHPGPGTLLVEGIHLASSYDRTREAGIQAALVPVEAEQAHVYGAGLGDLPSALLARPQLRDLHVVVLNEAVFRTVLAHVDARPWLGDPRMQLELAGPGHEVSAPFAANPACLHLASEAAARLRDLVVLELATPYINERFRVQSAGWLGQMRQNRPRLERDGDVAMLFGARSGQRLMVLAPGPSLAEHYEGLRTHRDQVYLIAVNTALMPLLAAGIVPDVVVVIDGFEEGILRHFSGGLDACAHTALVYSPVVAPAVLERWPGPRYAAYLQHPLYDELRHALPRGELFTSGSVLHSAVDLAVRMGAAEVALLGVDLCFPAAAEYVGGVRTLPQGTAPAEARTWVLDGHGQRVPTRPNYRGFLRDLEQYIARHPEVCFINGSRTGARIAGAVYADELQ